MLDTYKAILKGNHVEWTDDHPVPACQDQEVEVLITVLYEVQTQADLHIQRGERMAMFREDCSDRRYSGDHGSGRMATGYSQRSSDLP